MGAAGLLCSPRACDRPARRSGRAAARHRGRALGACCTARSRSSCCVAASAWSRSQPKTYVVNLVPAVAAVGSPQGRAAQPPRAAEPTPARLTRPRRAAGRRCPRPAPDSAARAADPGRPSCPRDRPSCRRATRGGAARPRACRRARRPPRPGEKELPRVASAPTPPAPTPGPATAAPAAEPPPPAALGRPRAPPQGAGALTLNASDFPFAWYLRQCSARSASTGTARRAAGHASPWSIFEIARDGQVSSVVDQGQQRATRYYDSGRAARDHRGGAVPAAPDGIPRHPCSAVHLGFNFTAGSRLTHDEHSTPARR